jgi:hypothetical protein
MGRGDTNGFSAGVLALALAACKAGDDGDFEFGEGSTGPSPLTTSETGTPATSGSDGADDSTDDGADESSGGDTDGGDESSTGEPLPTVPCTTLDILVVVDNSDTMTEEQAKIAMALGPFVTLAQSELPGVMGSIHVGVLSTDAPELVTSTPTAQCTPYASGASWMAYGDTLTTELACALALGVGGDADERPVQMTIEALAPEQIGLGGANQDFLREEGPLVVIFVTDEEDDFEPETEWGSSGDPADWVAAIAATKGGHEQDVVVLALVGTEKPNACPDYQWNGVDGAEIAPRLAELTESFPRHAVGDVCGAEYGTFLTGAVPQIVEACGNYVLP